MDDITSKIQYIDGVTPVPNNAVHTADEFNDRRDELQNAVTNIGLTGGLDVADSNQLSKAQFANGVAASSMLDSGGVNTIVLTPITGASGLRLAVPTTPDYSALDGAIFNFAANNTNTGNVTVNVGQTGGTLIGAQPLFLQDGTTQVSVGRVVAGKYYSVRYDSSLDVDGAFVLLPDGNSKAFLVFADTQIYSAAATTSWSDLDIATLASIPAERMIVILRVTGDGTNFNGFREKGQTHTMGGNTPNAAFVDLSGTGQGGLAVAVTDSDGIVEWISGGTHVTTIELVAYLKV